MSFGEDAYNDCMFPERHVSSSGMTISQLRDALLAALARLPGTREFHVHVLVSSPRKNASLYPFALPRPRAYLQDILILLSEQTTPDSPRVLVSAVEASVYNIVSTSCAIFYVSKVDSTGQAAAPSPTQTIVRALLLFYANPATRPIVADYLWIHLFARAQGQYLFPGSAEFAGKKPLSDVKLCGWWKRLLSEVAAEVKDRAEAAKVQLHYTLPGYNEVEAAHMLNAVSGSDHGATWIYGHPYTQSEIPLPCPRDAPEGMTNLGHLIPSFEDDPKSRFMDDIAYTTDGEIKSPVRKRTRMISNSQSKGEDPPKEKEWKDDKDRPLGELRKVSADEFWERMSFRQECVAGAITGFFTVGVSAVTTKDVGRSEVSPLAPQAGQVSSQMTKRVLASLTTSVEFSSVECSIRATGIVEGAIRRLCEGIASVPSGVTHAPRSLARPVETGRHTPEREISLVPPRTPPQRGDGGKRVMPDVSPNPFPEPVTSLETYESHIYGSTWVGNAVPEAMVVKQEREGATGPRVTVLTARKKNKRA